MGIEVFKRSTFEKAEGMVNVLEGEFMLASVVVWSGRKGKLRMAEGYG